MPEKKNPKTNQPTKTKPKNINMQRKKKKTQNKNKTQESEKKYFSWKTILEEGCFYR